VTQNGHERPVVLEARGITKRFPGVVANDNVSLRLHKGEVLALLGENGAGKSTLMNVLYGLYRADEGEILLDDEVQHFSGPGDAMAAGIGMVHQHFMLIPVFTVAENVMLGHEETLSGGRLDLAAARAKVREIANRFGFHVDPDAVVEDLPVGVQQRVEIIKALSRDAKVLVFDEPTAVLTPQETDELMAIMRQLKESGAAISRTRVRAASRSSRPPSPTCSLPSMTFSATVKTGMSMKCWCTMPMPAAIASPGPAKCWTSSSRRISPSSAW
jgi:simple sugar transport system ATP-binding protein